MRRVLPLAAIALTLAACQDSREAIAPAAAPGPELQAVVLDPALSAALADATAADTFVVVISFDETLTTLHTLTQTVLDLGLGVIQYEHLPMLGALATKEQITAVQALAGVESIYLNVELEYTLAGTLPSIHANEVHAAGYTGKGVGVAILDTGIDGLHSPDVAYPSKTVQNAKVVHGAEDTKTDLRNVSDDSPLRDLFYFKGQTNKTINKAANLFVEDQGNTDTSSGHGTHVGGIVAGTGGASGGKYTGVAPGAQLVGVGVGDALVLFWVLAGFDYILDNQSEYNIQVVNNSWGTSGMFDPENPVNQATRKLHDEGIAVVFSAGNCGSGGSLTCRRAGQNQVNPYSAAPWVISVAAGCKTVDPPVNTSGKTRCEDASGREPILADFSSRGLPDDELHHPDITAPGVYLISARASTGATINALEADEDLLICNNEIENQAYYTCASGTSMSGPVIAGVIALMEEAAGGTLTPDQAFDALVSTARPLEGYGLWEAGHGYVDARAAVEAVKK